MIRIDNNKAFQELLSYANKVIGKSTIELNEAITIDANKGKITVYGKNASKFYFKGTLDADVEQPVNFIVNFAKLYDIVNSNTQATLTMTYNNNGLDIKLGKAKYRVKAATDLNWLSEMRKMFDAETLPVFSMNIDEWNKMVKILGVAIINTDSRQLEVRNEVIYINKEEMDDKTLLCATNTFVLSYIESAIDLKTEACELMILRDVFSYFSNTIGDIHIKQTGNSLFLEANNVTFVAPTPCDKYYKVRDVLTRYTGLNEDLKVTLPAIELKAAMKALKPLSDNMLYSVDFAIGKETLTLLLEQTDTEEVAEYTIDIESKIENKFSLSYTTIRDIINNANDMITFIRDTSNIKHPIRVQTEGYEHVVMPINKPKEGQ